ncbi:Uronyl 2-sulfotransferase [Tupaia chinensis]|uniref:Uronyl 2-sulfotransferase n=1 Tax=Tupaia chinensis TaxID=246437 RepID=L9JBW0_TUPCH|nr:Uronyl 2-sulfotransferase [Tupaia chinensis]
MGGPTEMMDGNREASYTRKLIADVFECHSIFARTSAYLLNGMALSDLGFRDRKDILNLDSPSCSPLGNSTYLDDHGPPPSKSMGRDDLVSVCTFRFGGDQPVYINIIRDPVSRFLSNYFFRRFGDWRGEQNHMIRTPSMRQEERYLGGELRKTMSWSRSHQERGKAAEVAGGPDLRFTQVASVGATEGTGSEDKRTWTGQGPADRAGSHGRTQTEQGQAS